MFGAFILVPGVGHVDIGGYLLYMLLTAGLGAAGGALAAASPRSALFESGGHLAERSNTASAASVLLRSIRREQRLPRRVVRRATA